MTNVFISWSGELSKNIAEELRTWIPSVLQFAKPYFTPNDIEKGAKWSSEITTKLSETNVGIICLTRENFERPWILFEAGALSKDLDRSKVCSVLFGMEASDLSGPLTTFQTTSFEKIDFKKLMNAINDAGGENKLNRETFESVFEMWWPRLEAAILKIMETKASESKEELRSDRDLIEEILSLSRMSTRDQGIRKRGPIVPSKLISDLIDVTHNVLVEAKNFTDRDLLNESNRLVEINQYLASKHPEYSDVFESEISSLQAKAADVLARIQFKDAEKGETTDDEIPF